jgi:hypothetical protein
VHKITVFIFIRAAVISPLYWCKLHILILHLIGEADSTLSPYWCRGQPFLSFLMSRQHSATSLIQQQPCSSSLVQQTTIFDLIGAVTALFHLIGASDKTPHPYPCSKQASSSSMVQQTVLLILISEVKTELSCSAASIT